MNNDVVIDFETYYDKNGISVTDLGVPNYVKATDAYILSIARGNEAWCGEVKDIKSCPAGLLPTDDDQIWAANANFDQLWWEKYFGPSKKPWKCILDRGVVLQLPRHLGGLAQATLGTKVDKSVRSNMCGVKWEDLNEEEKQAVGEYCLNDAIIETQVKDALPPMSDFEDKLSAHTRMLNRRGVAIDEEAVEEAKTTLEGARHAALLAIPWSENAAPLSYTEFAKYCTNNGVVAPSSLAKTDSTCADWIVKNPGVAKALTSMREFRRANTLLEKVKSLQDRLVDGILPLELLYCGAQHTRRWSCRGFNVQNLDRDGVQFNIPGLPPEKSVVWTRKFIVPRPGKTFVILDLAQIEPRCLWWLVQDNAMLELVRQGFGIYEAHARATMGWAGGKLKDENPTLYRLAKARVLGLGYGCGAEKFKVVAKAMAELDLSTEECEKAVTEFRASNPKIVGMWRNFDKSIAATAVDKKCRDLDIQMPTGENLRHWNVSKKMSRNFGGFRSYTVKGEAKEVQNNLWGGVLTENVTQRMARDVLGVCILRLEEAGLQVAFHAHDEVILEVDTADAQVAYTHAKAIMETPPEWAPDLPLGAEGGVHSHYIK